MKSLVTEIRLFIAEWLLGVVFSVSPSGKEGEEIKVLIIQYFYDKVMQKKS